MGQATDKLQMMQTLDSAFKAIIRTNEGGASVKLVNYIKEQIDLFEDYHVKQIYAAYVKIKVDSLFTFPSTYSRAKSFHYFKYDGEVFKGLLRDQYEKLKLAVKAIEEYKSINPF